MLYSKDHEWIKIENNVGTVGISSHAIEQLGEIVFVELPEINKDVSKGDAIAIFESVKAASDIYTPVSGKILEVNDNLTNDLSSIIPEKANESWIFKIQLTNNIEIEELMDEKQYIEMISWESKKIC